MLYKWCLICDVIHVYLIPSIALGTGYGGDIAGGTMPNYPSFISFDVSVAIASASMFIRTGLGSSWLEGGGFKYGFAGPNYSAKLISSPILKE